MIQDVVPFCYINFDVEIEKVSKTAKQFAASTGYNEYRINQDRLIQWNCYAINSIDNCYEDDTCIFFNSHRNDLMNWLVGINTLYKKVIVELTIFPEYNTEHGWQILGPTFTKTVYNKNGDRENSNDDVCDDQ
jgi:hypothetical protein